MMLKSENSCYTRMFHDYPTQSTWILLTPTTWALDLVADAKDFCLLALVVKHMPSSSACIASERKVPHTCYAITKLSSPCVEWNSALQTFVFVQHCRGGDAISSRIRQVDISYKFSCFLVLKAWFMTLLPCLYSDNLLENVNVPESVIQCIWVIFVCNQDSSCTNFLKPHCLWYSRTI